MRRFDLRSLRFGGAGETWRRLPVEVAPFVFGGLEYTVVDGAVDLLLTAGRVGDAVTLAGEFEADVTGPCQRCLGQADVRVSGRGTEFVRHGESAGDDDESGYVAANILDVERWVRDMVAEALPPRLLCDDACLGLCPVCGADLNSESGHRCEEA